MPFHFVSRLVGLFYYDTDGYDNIHISLFESSHVSYAYILHTTVFRTSNRTIERVIEQ